MFNHDTESTGISAATIFMESTNQIKPRRRKSVLKLIDRHFSQLFTTEARSQLGQIWPGQSPIKNGARFGVKPKASSARYNITWRELLSLVKHEAKLTTEAQAVEVLDTYMKANLSIMTVPARLQFVRICSDDVMRSYLRVIE